MDPSAMVQKLRAGGSAAFPPEASTWEYAQSLDKQDSIKHLRNEFIIPSKASLRKTALDGSIPRTTPQPYAAHTNGSANGNGNGNGVHSEEQPLDEPSIYFVGNSLGAQPKAIRRYLDAQLETWASVGVGGHFTSMEQSPLVAWQHMAKDCADKSAAIVGALPHEVVVMNTLTINLHLMMASFYRPTEKRHKIICEWRPFPSDHYAIESQIQWHGLDPAKSMVKISPDSPSDYVISTEKVLATIDAHADETALLLLPGIQYYSGQLFDLPRITAHAKQRGIVVGWDLAHAAGNVELRLHDWDVDFACWCTYKYMNAGPGSIAGAFVHERHGKVDWEETAEGGKKPNFRHRLTGWYGGDLSVRFNMDNNFQPTPGAGGFQCSNPSAVDLASLSGALSVFAQTDMAALRSKSLLLTAYAEHLLDGIIASETAASPSFRIITPRDPTQRGAQLSVLLRDGLLEHVGGALKENGIACDQRKPDVIRVAPVPLYCGFGDVWKFMDVLRKALAEANGKQ